MFLHQGTHWTPSKMIHRLGKEINNPDSVYYWAYKVMFEMKTYKSPLSVLPQIEILMIR